jgi:hypothetical protein
LALTLIQVAKQSKVFVVVINLLIIIYNTGVFMEFSILTFTALNTLFLKQMQAAELIAEVKEEVKVIRNNTDYECHDQ